MTNSSPTEQIGPRDSTATGTNTNALDRSAYFLIFSSAAISAAALATWTVPFKCESAKESDTVASQARHRLSDHGIIVNPPGRCSSELARPLVSKTDGTPALPRARSFSASKPASSQPTWKSVNPSRIHNRVVPHEHRCVVHSTQPRRNPTATRIESSSNLRPQDATGNALSQFPAWGAETAKSLALSIGPIYWACNAVFPWAMATASLTCLAMEMNRLTNRRRSDGMRLDRRHGICGLCDGSSWHYITKWDTLTWFDHTRFCTTVSVSKQE